MSEDVQATRPGRGGKRLGAGRPVTTGRTSQTYSLTLSLKDGEELVRRAEGRGVSVSEFIRACVLNEISRSRPGPSSRRKARASQPKESYD